MRTWTPHLFIVAVAISGCNRQSPAVTDHPAAAAAPASAGTTVPRDANDAPPTAAPAAGVGTAPGPARPQPGKAASPAAPASDAAATSAPAIEWREITIPAGTTLALVLETPVASDTSRTEAPVTGRLTRALTVDGSTAVPRGSLVYGVVSEVTRAAKVKGLAHITLKFDSLAPQGEDERYPIRASSVSRTAAATKQNDAIKILAPALGGAIIGRIAGGRKGAAIGAGTGAGAGTAVVMGSRGKEVRLGKGAPLTLRLTEPLTVRVGK